MGGEEGKGWVGPGKYRLHPFSVIVKAHGTPAPGGQSKQEETFSGMW